MTTLTSNDASSLHSLMRSLENLSKKRYPDPKDLDGEFFVTANIGHASKSAAYWLPIVKDIYTRLVEDLSQPFRQDIQARVSTDDGSQWFVELVHCGHTVRTAKTFETRDGADGYLYGINLWLGTPSDE